MNLISSTKAFFVDRLRKYHLLNSAISQVSKLKARTKNKRKFKSDRLLFLEHQNDEKRGFDSVEIKPYLNDLTTNSPFDAHYTYHPAWAVRKVKEINPEFHVDISSTIRFGTMLSAFVPVKLFDYRPVDISLPNLETHHADVTNLHFESSSIVSLSCMHTVEHIGLGRYGDNVDYNGDIKAISELKRVLSVGGNLLFVVPVGKPRIVFNAHRIYSYNQIMNEFDDFDLIEFSLISDEGDGLLLNPSEEIINDQNYGCGCFWFRKK